MSRPALRRLTILTITLCAACVPPSRSELELMQSVQDLGDAVNVMQQDYGFLAETVDSLRVVVARQDSLLRTLANLSGVAVPSAP
jgi:hypothetical protein